MSQVTPSQPVPQDVDRVLARAREGDKTVLPELRALLDSCPMLWQTLGDLSRHNCNSWVRLLAGNDLLAAEAIRRNLAAMQENLLGPSPSQLELLLAERVASTFMQTQHAEMAIADKAGSALPLAGFLLKRADSAGRRLASSVKLLVTVQHLAGRKSNDARELPCIESAAASTATGSSVTPKAKKRRKHRTAGVPGRSGTEAKSTKLATGGTTKQAGHPVEADLELVHLPLPIVGGVPLGSGCPAGHDEPRSVCHAKGRKTGPLKTAGTANGAIKPINRLFGHLLETAGTDGNVE